MRDRLIEILGKFRTPICTGINFKLPDVEGLADYLIENRVIVPPCKKGDTMYCDGRFFANHCKGEIMSFPVDIVLTEVCSTFRGEIDMVFDFNQFGKDVFLTREEAEQALKEAQG